MSLPENPSQGAEDAEIEKAKKALDALVDRIEDGKQDDREPSEEKGGTTTVRRPLTSEVQALLKGDKEAARIRSTRIDETPGILSGVVNAFRSVLKFLVQKP